MVSYNWPPAALVPKHIAVLWCRSCREGLALHTARRREKRAALAGKDAAVAEPVILDAPRPSRRRSATTAASAGTGSDGANAERGAGGSPDSAVVAEKGTAQVTSAPGQLLSRPLRHCDIQKLLECCQMTQRRGGVMSSSGCTP
jgi:hypothetical protein